MSDEATQVSTYGLVDTKDEVAVDRRRRWPEAAKRRMVAETRMPGTSVSVVTRRYDVNANQLFRCPYQHPGFGAKFLRNNPQWQAPNRPATWRDQHLTWRLLRSVFG